MNRRHLASLPPLLRPGPRFVLVLLLLLAGGRLAGRELPPRTPQELKGMSVEQLLQQPVISVSRQPEAWGETANGVFYMSGRVPEVIGATRLPEVLRMAPNLFVAQINSSQWAINARGFVRANGYSNKLLVLVDGRSVYSPFFSNVFWDTTDVFLPDLEQIEVISGPAGANWGSNAVNGVINVISRSAHDTQGGYLYAGLGTERESTLGARYGGRIGENGAWRVYAKRNVMEPTLAAAGTEDGQDPADFSQAGFRTDWDLENGGTFTFQGDVYAGRFDAGVLDDGTTEGGNLLARWSRELGSDSELWIRAYYDYSRRNTHSLLLQTTHTLDLEFQHSSRLDERQSVLWGANYRLYDDRMEDTIGFIILPEELIYDVGSVFAQYQLELIEERLRLTAGLRLEHNYFSGWDPLPNVRLAWRPIAGQTFWASIARAARVPDRLDKGFHIPVEPPYFVIGGPDFKPEILHAYELGWRGSLAPQVSASAVAFFHDYSDLRSVGTELPITIGNDVAGESYGLELFLDWDVASWWRLRTGGFYVEQNNWITDGGVDGDQAAGEISFPNYQLLLRSTFRLRRDVALWLSLRHVDEVPGFDANVRGTVPDYTELDATLQWDVSETLEFALTGRNLLDKSHPEIGLPGSWRQLERSVHLLARYRF